MEEKKTVLIVEDEKSIVDIVRFNLEKEGYAALTAYDGEAGLDQADYFPTLDEAKNALSREVRAGVTILVKASRSMAFEKIVDFLLTNVPQ